MPMTQITDNLPLEGVGSVHEWPFAHTLVVGMGKTGLSLVRFFCNHGIRVAVTDNRIKPPGEEELRREFPGVALFAGEFSSQAFDYADVLLVSPGVALDEPLIQQAISRGVPVWGDIEVFSHFATAPVVAITGSNGKSTVTMLVTKMAEASGLQVAAGGNLGTPALDLLKGDVPDLYILELSSFQLERTDNLTPVAATVLNISADHMDRYPHLAAYAESKSRVYYGDGVMIINSDDAWVAAMEEPNRKIKRFTMDAPREKQYGVMNVDGREWLAKGSKGLMAVDELRLPGRHNIANALAALALGDSVELDLSSMLEVLRTYTGLPHRTQWVAESDGVTWYNDSKGTNVGATIAAIEGLTPPLVLIAGGVAKGADFTPLREAMSDKVRAVILFGQDADIIEDALSGVVQIHRAVSLIEAVKIAVLHCESGDNILFSPACASFDMFANYEERGNAFMELVEQHVRKGGVAA